MLASRVNELYEAMASELANPRHRDRDGPPLPSQPREQNAQQRITSTSDVYDFTCPE
jgi:hypothetical protein